MHNTARYHSQPKQQSPQSSPSSRLPNLNTNQYQLKQNRIQKQHKQTQSKQRSKTNININNNNKYDPIQQKQQNKNHEINGSTHKNKSNNNNNKNKIRDYIHSNSQQLLKQYTTPNTNININQHIHLHTHSHTNKNIRQFRSRHSSSLSTNQNVGNIKSNNQLRSKALSVMSLKPSTQFIHNRNTPYDKFVKQMNIRLPTPKQKFLQFIHIPPFNRLKNHIQFITHILKQTFQFFKMHPQYVIQGIAKKIIQIKNIKEIPKNYLLIINQGNNIYYNGKIIQRGTLLCRNNFQIKKFSSQGQLSLFGLPYHQYNSFVSEYLQSNIKVFKKFIQSIQIFKIFTQIAIQKMYSNLTLQFLMKGQSLYQPGDHANQLYLIYSGAAARKIIVQIDKTNKIPLQKYSKLIKVLSRSYQHRIKFQTQDLVGIADIVDSIPHRSQSIIIDQNATILSIDRNSIQENLDQYITDRLKKYNLRKYPKNYDQLCDNYLKLKLENRKAQERKIAALKDQINRDQNNDRKNQKISNIIKIYQERIRMQEKQHLIDKKKMERVINNQL